MTHQMLVTHGTVVTLGQPARVIPDGAVVIRGNRIEHVGPRLSVRADPAHVVDAAGGVILPGFINAHTHLYSTLACGFAPEPKPANFVEILERLWWRLDQALTSEDVQFSARVALSRSLRAGVTTVLDHHASPSALRGSLEIIAAAAKEVGVRACLSYEVSDRDGDAVAKDGIEENVCFIRQCAQAGDPMIAALFGLHASMTLSPRTLAQAVDAAHTLDTGFHIHVSESDADVQDSLAKYGKPVVHRLADEGVLGPKTLCAHGVHVDDTEMTVLGQAHASVVHNPQSNMNNAVGAADVRGMIARGVVVGLGSDGMTCNMLDELRAAHLLPKHVAADPRVGFVEACGMLLENNAHIATRCFGVPLGALAPDHRADIVVWDYLPPTPLDERTFPAHLMFGLPASRPTTVIVDGRVRVENGQVLGVDEREVAARSRELAAALWRRLGQ